MVLLPFCPPRPLLLPLFSAILALIDGLAWLTAAQGALRPTFLLIAFAREEPAAQNTPSEPKSVYQTVD